MIQFNPFNKPIEALQAQDLATLRSVEEGWYIEYKREVPNVASIAKSISAFSNHYGGWLFYGIAQTSDGCNCAGAFTGIEKAGVGQALEQIRNAVVAHINPQPFYDHRIIEGPCPDIDLPDGHVIIVIVVPTGSNAPYIHSSGRIYRRIADSSDPKAETDRTVLDILWERSNNARDRLAEFLDRSPALSQQEQNTPYLDLYLLPDPLGDKNLRASMNILEFAEIMRCTESHYGSVSYDNVFSAPDSFIARQVNTNSAYNRVLTWRYHLNGASVVSVPMGGGRIRDLQAIEGMTSYEFAAGFLELCTKFDLGFAYLMDMNLLLALIMGIVHTHHTLSDAAGVPQNPYAKLRFQNVWRTVPFLDVPAYMEYVARYGIPVIQDEECFTLPGKTPESFIELGRRFASIADQETIPQLDQALELWIHSLCAVGLEGLIHSWLDNSNGVSDCVGACDRAMVAWRSS